MTPMTTNYLPGSLLLAGSLSLAGSISLYSPVAQAENLTELQKGMHGLRDVYVSVQTKYSTVDHACRPPENSSSEFPEMGIDLSAYRDVNKGLKAEWDALISVEMDQGGVSDEIKEDAEAAIDVLNRLDGKSGDGVVTKQEWINGQKTASDEDKKFDLRLLYFFKGVSDYLLASKNPGIVDPETYPELIQARALIKIKDDNIASLETTLATKTEEAKKLGTDLSKAKEEASLYQNLSYGLGGALGLVGLVSLAFGIRAVRRGGNKKTPVLPKAPETKLPPLEKKPEVKTDPKDSERDPFLDDIDRALSPPPAEGGQK